MNNLNDRRGELEMLRSLNSLHQPATKTVRLPDGNAEIGLYALHSLEPRASAGLLINTVYVP